MATLRRVALLAVGTLLFAPPASAETAVNFQESSFGRIEMPATATFSGEPVELLGRLVVGPESGVGDAAYFLIGLSVPSPRGHAELLDLKTESGEAVPFLRDERAGNPQEPKFILYAAQLPAARTPILVTARFSTTTNGQFHVGAVAVAFDADWRKLATPAGDPSELYAFSVVRAEGLERGPFDPPFVGQGNVPGPGGVGFAVAVAVGAFAFRRYGWSS